MLWQPPHQFRCLLPYLGPSLEKVLGHLSSQDSVGTENGSMWGGVSLNARHIRNPCANLTADNTDLANPLSRYEGCLIPGCLIYTWVCNGTSGIMLTGELNSLLFRFTQLTLQRSLSCPLGIWWFHLQEREIRRVCHLSLQPLWTLEGRWRNELACVWCCIHLWVPCFPLMRCWLF